MQFPQKNNGLKQVLGQLDPNLARVFVPFALRHPSKLRAYGRLIRAFKQTELVRQDAKSRGTVVPPFLILSITSRCNLQCAGCYAAAVGTVPSQQTAGDARKKGLNPDQWRHVIQEARELGVFTFILAGGEPFMFPSLLDICGEFSDRLFLIFTNGTALKAVDFTRLKRLPNVAVVVSIEGDQAMTDARRGRGVHEKALRTLEQLKKAGVLSGISVTITRDNYHFWMDPASVDMLLAQGIRLGFFVEYIPASQFESDLVSLTKEERALFRAKMLEYRATKPLYLMHSPGDELNSGGCVSAGRGFAHVTPNGDLTPCPVSDLATHNLATASLRDGLNSPLFQKIRETDHLLENGDTPCALFAHPKEVEQLARITGAYRTGKSL